MKLAILRGQSREFPLVDVLRALGLGRQYMSVELYENGGPVGAVLVKSGRVLSAETADSRGLPALFWLLQRVDGDFSVFRSETPSLLPEPLGQIESLLREAAQRSLAASSALRENTAAFQSLRRATPPPLPAQHSDSPSSPAPPPVHTPAPPPVHTPAPPQAHTPAPPQAHTPVPPQAHTPVPPQAHTPVPPSVAPSRPPAADSQAPTAQQPEPPASRVTSAPPRRSVASPSASTSRSAPPPARQTIPPPANPAPIRRPKAALAGRILAVASPKGGCGKTTIALNLSLSLARQGRRVILVDADINGDVLSTINARARAEIGAFDVILGVASSEEALLDTVLPHFKILPAVGGQLPRAESISADHSAGWRALLRELAKRTDVVVVDTPAGMFGVTHQVLLASTHVVGVLQAEAVANRSFPRFLEALRAIPEELRPEVLGIVVNMLQTKHSASLSVFQTACSDLPGEWLFDTSIPRHRAFLDATQLGLPLRHLDEQSPPAVAWLFDNLAAEVAERLRLGTVEKKPQPLLL